MRDLRLSALRKAAKLGPPLARGARSRAPPRVRERDRLRDALAAPRARRARRGGRRRAARARDGERPPPDPAERRLTAARARKLAFEESLFWLSSVVGAGVGTLIWPGHGTTLVPIVCDLLCETFVSGPGR